MRSTLARLSLPMLALGAAMPGPACSGAAADPPARATASEEEAFKIKELALDMLVKGLRKPLEDLIGKQATRLVDLVFDITPNDDHAHDFAVINEKLDALDKLAAATDARLDDLRVQLAKESAETQSAVFNARIGTPTALIEAAYSGKVSTSLGFYTDATISAETKRRAAKDFVAAINPLAIQQAINEIHDTIVVAQGKSVLDTYADLLALQLSKEQPVDVALAALEARFVQLVITELQGLRVLTAYYQFAAMLDPSSADIELANIPRTLAFNRPKLVAQASAYTAAVARYAAVKGGDPERLAFDPATGSVAVDSELLKRVGRAAVVGHVVRDGLADDASAASADSESVHALFLARATDPALAHLTITATSTATPARSVSRAIDATPMSTNGVGQYGYFRSAEGGSTALALSDEWAIFDVELPLPGTSDGADVQLVVTSRDAIGSAPFTRTTVLSPVHIDGVGPNVYVLGDDFRMEGPTSRADLFTWGPAEQSFPKLSGDPFDPTLSSSVGHGVATMKAEGSRLHVPPPAAVSQRVRATWATDVPTASMFAVRKLDVRYTVVWGGDGKSEHHSTCGDDSLLVGVVQETSTVALGAPFQQGDTSVGFQQGKCTDPGIWTPKRTSAPFFDPDPVGTLRGIAAQRGTLFTKTELLKGKASYATGANGDLVIQSGVGTGAYGTRPDWSSVSVTSTLLKFGVYQLQ